ncbi:MAG: LysM peptidoglycan-binding domain-containing protein [Enterococcus sp.]
MGKFGMNRLRDNVEQKYRAKRYKLWKNGIFKGLLLSILLLGCAILFSPENVQSAVWQANSVETIKAKMQVGKNSYTFEAGDTFYNIGLAVNVKWQTLMALNGFEEGSQYTVPVGTTIKFDGSKITVTDQNGNAINEKELTEADKIDPSKPFANQSSNSSQNGEKTTSVTPAETQKTQTNQVEKSSTVTVKGEVEANQAETPIDKAQAEKEKQAAEAEREQAESEKQTAEKERQEAERLKQEAEQKLTEALNKENTESYAELQAKQTAATTKVTEAQANYDGLTAQLAVVEQNVAAAATAQQSAQTVLTTAQTAINSASANQATAQQRVNDVSAQISTLQSQAGSDAAIQAQLEQLNQQLAAAQGELNAYGAQVAAAQQSVNTAQAAYSTAEATLNSGVAEKASIERAIGQAQLTLTAAQQELANLPQSSTAATSDEAKKIQAELSQYNDRITALEKQISSLANKIQALDNRIAELDQLIQGVTNEAKTVEAEGKQAEDSAADTNQHVDKANDTATEVENKLPHIPANVDMHVTILMDDEGNTITDTTGYVKVSESAPEKTVEILPNGDTITTYTTTVTYHKIVNKDKEVINNVDEAGNPLTNLEGYFKINESAPEKTIETLPNGDTITTYTTTVTYHKIVNKDEKVINNIDEVGNVLTNLDGYFKIAESVPEKTIETLANGDTITTYTTTMTYHKIVNKDEEVVKNVDQSGKELTDLTGYEKVSESQPVKTVERLSNGDTITTYTTTVTYKKIVDPIIEAIKSADDAELKTIKEQIVTDNTRVTVEQADKLVNVEFSKEVAKHFERLVQEEQTKYKEKLVSNTKDEAAYREIAERAVEVMYKFSHTRPSNLASDGTYVVEREVGSQKMGFFSENNTYVYIEKSAVNGNSALLAQLIAQQMFNQYIENEREAGRANDYTKGGHYMNIIMSGHTDMALAVFIMDDEDYPDRYYKVANTVSTGYVSIVK